MTLAAAIPQVLVACVLALLTPWNACEGAIEAYLSLKGKSAGAQTIEDPVQVLGFTKGTENTLNIGSSSGGAGAGKAMGKPATLSLTPSKAVTEMFKGLLKGEVYQMKLWVRRAGDGAVLGELSCDDVMFSDLSITAASGDDVPEVEIEFFYGAMFWKEYFTVDIKGGAGSNSAGWSFVTNTAVNADFFGDGGGGEPPVTTDGDHDGVPDAWEDANGMNKNLTADGSQDMDGDSMSNLQEYIAGTDPRSGSSFFSTRIHVATGVVELEWSALSGRIYRVYGSANLNDGFTLLTEITGALGTRIYQPAARTGPFYRVEATLAP